ncbi:MAG TPA: chemotaxis protein CheW [Ramlibacter sp.]|uniref:chemotaxis protein CheW n=1 Tax=Ramlibacter sp. TaxID=1917967 RepID=UPI002BA3136A|nr:chemotaxis protein CheW [Ramlibacter sp.]HVZ46060.1 chemotaxis protein CheW [Ramlibacter sp.]
MTTAIARLVEYAPGKCIALAAHATVEIVKQPAPVAVPGAAHHAMGLLAWQGQRIAMIDLAAWAKGARARESARYALVLACGPGAFAALALDALPVNVTVRDAQQCDLPERDAPLRHAALSCVDIDGEAVPIVDVARLLGAPTST